MQLSSIALFGELHTRYDLAESAPAPELKVSLLRAAERQDKAAELIKNVLPRPKASE